MNELQELRSKWYKQTKCKKSSTGRHSWFVPKGRTDREHCCRLCGEVTLNSAVHKWASDEWAGVFKELRTRDNLVISRLLSLRDITEYRSCEHLDCVPIKFNANQQPWLWKCRGCNKEVLPAPSGEMILADTDERIAEYGKK